MQGQHIIEGFRLSPQQERLWSFQEATYEAVRATARDRPIGHVYRSHGSMLLDGLLKVNKLQVAIERAVSRHEVYRTCLRRVPGRKIPLQVVAEHCLFTWEQVNLCDYDPEEQHPINLEYGPLLHFSLVSIADHKHILFVHLSALHADSRSLENLMGRIAQGYATDFENRKSHSAGSMVQYSQFSAWQNALLDTRSHRASPDGQVGSNDWATTDGLVAPDSWACSDGREYWRKLDLSLLAGWGLPYEYKSNSTEVFIPDSLIAPAPNDLHAQLSLLIKRYDTSAAQFLLACWHILLWRLTGRETSLIGIGADGRIVEGLAETAGLLTKYVPLSCRLSDGQRFSEILMQVKRTMDEVHKWQHYFTWDDVKQTSGSAVKSPSFPFSFEFSHWPAPFVAEGVSFSLRECCTYPEPFKIKISAIQKADDALVLEFHYNTSLFSVNAIQRLADQYYTLLQSALEGPEAPILFN
jgi:hypothetical protein